MATNTYVELDRVTVEVATPSITFTSIPGGYTDLVIVMDASAASYVNSYIRFNGDTAANYSATRLYGSGSAASSSKFSTETFSYIGDLHTTRGVTTLHIQDYANSTTVKPFLSRDNAANGGLGLFAGLWRKTPLAPVTSIEIGATSSTNITVGSTFSLYGIRAEGVSPTVKATGGAVYSDADYYYHVFGASGIFAPTQSITADVLVVAGGGGSGCYYAGGGGAGGFRVLTSQSLTAINHTVTVGAGGPGVNEASPNKGNNSSFASISSTGGGAGNQWPATSGIGNPGGSGGGGSLNFAAGGAGNQGAYSPSEGNNGGAGGKTGGNESTGGGGGAGGVGGNAGNGTVGGTGGIGNTTTFNIWGLATGVGQNINGAYYIAGGGGGGTNNPASTPGIGGFGGGGTGGIGNGSGGGTVGSNGLANTGSGAGGAAREAGIIGGSGGSGVVIVRYAKV